MQKLEETTMNLPPLQQNNNFSKCTIRRTG